MLVEQIDNGIDAHDIEMLLFTDATELTVKFKNSEKNILSQFNDIFSRLISA